jgi:WS/DGAT/MGAT family acyltransferase
MTEPAFLSQNDTIMWTVEADPLLRSTIMGIAVLDSTPPWEDLVARVEHATHMVPTLRQRVERAPLHPTTLMWIDDPMFALDQHLHRLALPRGATLDDALHLARTSAASGFDRARPLWDFTLVEGLPDGASVWCMKAHHVLTDGIGSVQLAAHLFDLEPSAPPPTTPAHDGDGPHRPSWPSRLLAAMEHDVGEAVEGAVHSMEAVMPDLVDALRHPWRALAAPLEVARSVGRLVRPVATTLSPVMTDRQLAGAYRTLVVDQQALHDAAAAHGASLNDAFLAGITGGLRRYHAHHGADADRLRVAMPISIRTDHDDAGGNHVTVMRFEVRVGDSDPVHRMQAMGEQVKGLRAERSIPITNLVAGALNLMPRGVIGSMLKHVDFLASNVPGVPVPLYLVGSKVEQFFPFGPTAGSSVNVTLMSYDGRCCIGVNTDGAAIPDPDVFLRHLSDGFDEVLAAGGR